VKLAIIFVFLLSAQCRHLFLHPDAKNSLNIKEIKFFSHMNEEDRKQIANLPDFKQFLPEEYLIQEG
jgi:hypothetical protein